MLFYILFAFSVTSLLGLGYLYPNKNKLFQWVVFIIIIGVAGFRDHIGVDFDSYVEWYIHKTRDDKLEFGFVAIMNIFRFFNLSYHFIFFFFSFLTCLFLFLGIKKYTANQNFAFLVFLILPEMYLNSFCLIRQSFSVAICFYAFYYLMNKKYLIYLLLMIVGVSIHYSAVLPFLLFLIVFKYADKINVWYIAIMLIASFLLSKLSFIQIFDFLFENTRYSYYFSQHRVPVNIYKIIVLNIVAFFVLFHFEKMKNRYPYQKYIILLYFFSVIFMNLFSALADMARIAYYFRIFEIIVIADLIFLGAKERRVWLFIGFYIYYFSAFIYTLKGDLEMERKSKLTPYKTYILDRHI